MTEDVSDIAEYYNSNLELERSRLERHPLEHELTWRYLEQYLPAQGSILEVGAATGRYTLALAQRGYRVTAVDLSVGLLDANRESIASAGLAGRVLFLVADARDLGQVTGRGFDVALLMGPLYHLTVESDRRLALKEARDHLRTGGLLFSSFISRYGAISDLIKKDPGWIEDRRNAPALLEMGHRPDDDPPGGFRAYFARVAEISPLHESMGFETLSVAGVEPAIGAGDETYDVLQGERRQRWLDFLFKISTEASIIGASRHLLYIGRKK